MKTFSDQRLDSYCAFCGGFADTRDHVPSKILLEKPFPENLPVIPACLECNNSFSLDEEYVACLIECTLHGTTDSKKLTRQNISKILSEKISLKTRLENSKTEVNNTIYFNAEIERVRNVVLKLAQGHSRFENSESQLEEPSLIWFKPLTAMSEKEQDIFFLNEEITLSPEIGSRALQRIRFRENGIPESCWQIVQPNSYCYSVSYKNSGMRVRIIIRDYLACEVAWKCT